MSHNPPPPHGAVREPGSAARWHVLIAGFLCYGFDAVDFMVLALALPAIIAEWHLSLGEAGLVGTAGMLGVGASGVLTGWLADGIGKRRALLVCFAGATLLLPAYAAIRDPRLLLWAGPMVAVFFAYAGPFGAYFPELYPTRVRSLGSGFCFDVGRGIAALAPFALGALATRYALGTAIALSALGFLCAALVMLALPRSDPASAAATGTP